MRNGRSSRTLAYLKAIVLTFIAFTSFPLYAENEDQLRVQGYGFSGIRRSSSQGALFSGGGGELGLVSGSPAISANASFHLDPLPYRVRLVPFVTGGLTLVSSDSPGLFNFGAGVNAWMKPRVALRLELRDYFFLDMPSQHLVALRMALRSAEVHRHSHGR